MSLLKNLVILAIFVIIQSISALEIVSMTVDVGDGVITRGQSLSPSFTVEFADGQKWNDSVFNYHVMFFTLDDPTNSIEVDWWGSRFRRRTGAVDATVNTRASHPEKAIK